MSDLPELMPAVILAGGLATRMRPLTETLPKALLQVEGHPFLWHQLQLLKRSGVGHVVLLVGHIGKLIEKEFGDGSSVGIQIRYSYDGPTPLGTGGAIRQALPVLPDSFFVLYGDSYLPCNYRSVEEAFHRSGLPSLMTVYRNEGRYDLSNVEFDGNRILRYDKRNRTPEMRYIDYGLGAFEAKVFEALPAGKYCDLEMVYRELLNSGELASFEVHERFYEIGSPEGLRETAEFIRSCG